MLYDSAAPVGAAVGAIAATVALAKGAAAVSGAKLLAGGVIGAFLAPEIVIGAAVFVVVWGVTRWIERA